MNRLVVNPNRPDSWEIQLKEGTNKLGRGDATDFKIADGSVSSSHCEIVVNRGSVTILDLGSTNGTFINDTPTQSATLQNGETIRLGQVAMIFYADATDAVVIPAAPAVAKAAPRLRVSGFSHAPEAPAPVAAETPPPLAPAFDLSQAAAFCKFHPKNAARWFCPKCNKSFCELCVNVHGPQKTCRACAVECAPLEVQAAAPSTQGFTRSLPGAFIYPFRGSGVFILIFATVLFSAMGFFKSGLISIVFRIGLLGYLFSYMQNIIHATAAEEAQMPEMPGRDDLFGAFLRLAGTVAMSFGLPIGLLVAKFCEIEIPTSAIIVAVILGCIYFPMAFLAVAIKDNVLASNPLVILPSILRVPGQYLITVFLFGAIFGIQQIGNLLSAGAGAVAFSTTSLGVMFASFGIAIVWSFLKVYLLTVNTRILGLLYLTQKERLGWF
jgi:hypothetical protein